MFLPRPGAPISHKEHIMPLVNIFTLHSRSSSIYGFELMSFNYLRLCSRNITVKPLVIKARANCRKESPKIRNRRIQKKFNGTPTRPRLSVFCSDEQLYAMLVDDENKKCLFYATTLKKSIRQDPPCNTIEAAQRVGEELVRACENLNVHEISSYDRNGFAQGEKIKAFEIAISQYGFLPR